MRAFVVAGLIGMVGLGAPVSVYGSEFGLEVNGMVTSFVVQPVKVQGEVMVDGAEFARMIGGSSSFDGEALTVRLGDDVAAVYRKGNTVYYFNGQRRVLRASVLAGDEGGVLLPIRHVLGSFGGSARVSDGVVVVNAPQNVVMLLPEIEAGSNVITLEQAFLMAQNNNSSISAISGNVAFMEQQRRSAVVDFDMAWWAGMGQGAQQALRAVRSIEAGIGASRQQVSVLQGASRMLVVNSLNTLRGQQIDRLLLQENIELQEENLRLVQLRNQHGMASGNELVQGRRQLETSRETLRALELSIRNQRAALNNVLGLAPTQDTYVAGGIRIVGLGESVSEAIANIEIHAQSVARSAPNVEILRGQLAVAQANYDTAQPFIGAPAHNPEANATDRATMRNALNNASRELEDTVRNIEEGVRNAYGQLLVLEAQRAALEVELVQAREAYNAARSSLEAGLITAHEVQAARVGILNVEANILRNGLAYENLMFAFENPFLLG